MGDKKTINVNIDKEVAEYLTTNYDGMVSKIFNSLSSQFVNEVKENGSILSNVIHGDFRLCKECRDEDC